MKEKWSKGTYIVPLQNKFLSRNGFVTAYKPYQIISSTPLLPFIIDDNGNKVNFVTAHEESEAYHGIRWFETKEKAEEFAKTLVESVKEEVKQPLKQAVRCATQEEWDFVLSKLPSCKLSKESNRFKDYFESEPSGIAIDTSDCSWDSLEYLKKENYQILSFQEWCNLNGYKMEKEVKFEVGKWYKAYYAGKIYFLKYKNTISRNGYNQINYSEFINNGVYKANDSISNTDLENSFKVLNDLEEIQQYLPDDHPDKINFNRKFKIGDVVVWKYENYIDTIKKHCDKFKNSWYLNDKYNSCSENGLRHATPEEINNHLISIGQIPIGEPLNTGIEPNKDGAFEYKSALPESSWSGGTIQNHLEAIIPTTGNCYNKDFATSYIPIKPKMILSIDDEEFPMVNIIKTNSIKQLLSDD